MKCALFLLCVAIATASADGGHIKVPAGWSSDDAEAKRLTAKANALSHFGGSPSMATVEAYVGPLDLGAGLYVTTVVAKQNDNRDAAIRAEVDSFLAGPTRAQLTSPQITIGSSESSVDPAKRQIVAAVSYADADVDFYSASRLVLVASAEELVSVTVECVHRDPHEGNVHACTDALANIDPGLPLASRTEVTLVAAASSLAPAPHATLPSSPTMSDGTRKPLPPIVVSGTPKQAMDRRPVYVGLGIILLAAVFWWNRRHRERLEAMDEKDNDGR